MQVTRELLSTFPSLKTLPQATLDELAPHCEMRKFARRGIVLNANVHEEHVCFLFEGRLQGVDFTIDGREVGLYFVEPGDFCGELGMFDRGLQPEFVIALTAAMVVFVPTESLRQITLKHAQLLGHLSERLAYRVRQLVRQRSLLALPSISQRVCCQLWMLVPEQDRAGQTESTIVNPPTHMELAIMLSLSRETVSRVFQTLQSRKIVQRDGANLLRVIDLNALKRLAEGADEL